MTVRELIKALQQLPEDEKDLPVKTFTYGTQGNVIGVETHRLEGFAPYVYLEADE